MSPHNNKLKELRAAAAKTHFEIPPDVDREVSAALRAELHRQNVTDPLWQQEQVLITMCLLGIEVKPEIAAGVSFPQAVAVLINQLTKKPLCWRGIKNYCNFLLSASTLLLDAKLHNRSSNAGRA